MKLKITRTALISIIVLVAACTNKNTVENQSFPTKRFISYHNGDTAKAFLEISESVFKGRLEIKYKQGYKDSGDVKGAIKGDTLIGDYHYEHYGLPKWQRDPIIFLKKGKKLIKGSGVLRFTLGFPGFNKNIPIDFNEKDQFVFEQIK